MDTFKNYEVDGKALVMLDDEDFENLNIKNKVHIKKILVEMKRIYKATKPDVISEKHKYRRERIRRQKMYNAAARVVQACFRRYCKRKELRLTAEVKRVQKAAAKFQKLVELSKTWWTDLGSVPSKQLLPDGGQIGSDRAKVIAAYKKHSNGLQKTDPAASVVLPPIKTFGKRRDYLSIDGWGRRGDGLNSKWTPSPAAVLEGQKKFLGDAPLSSVFTDKLVVNGYDKNRRTKFSGEEY